MRAKRFFRLVVPILLVVLGCLQPAGADDTPKAEDTPRADGRWRLGAGSGITVESDAESEYEETRAKALSALRQVDPGYQAP